MKIWTIKCREKLADGSKGWHWRSYFAKNRDGGGYNWGGDSWIRSAKSLQLLRDEVKQGDFVVCYQFDDKSICGFTRFHSDPYEDAVGSGRFSTFDLLHPSDALFLNQPVSIPQLREKGCSPACYGTGTQGTIFPVSRDEFVEMVGVVSNLQEGGGSRLHGWLNGAGFSLASLPVDDSEDNDGSLVGAGFGTSHEHNRKVEQAAIEAVWTWYEDRGWKIRDRQKDGCGYDLCCTKNDAEHHVEVKGVSGKQTQVILTRKEYETSTRDPNFVLCIVTGALTDSPEIEDFFGHKDISDAFSVVPLAYQATLRK